jgi:hypothetical protein
MQAKMLTRRNEYCKTQTRYAFKNVYNQVFFLPKEFEKKKKHFPTKRNAGIATEWRFTRLIRGGARVCRWKLNHTKKDFLSGARVLESTKTYTIVPILSIRNLKNNHSSTSQEQDEGYFNNAEHLKHPESLRVIKQTFQRRILKKTNKWRKGEKRRLGPGRAEHWLTLQGRRSCWRWPWAKIRSPSPSLEFQIGAATEEAGNEGDWVNPEGLGVLEQLNSPLSFFPSSPFRCFWGLEGSENRGGERKCGGEWSGQWTAAGHETTGGRRGGDETGVV